MRGISLKCHAGRSSLVSWLQNKQSVEVVKVGNQIKSQPNPKNLHLRSGFRTNKMLERGLVGGVHLCPGFRTDKVLAMDSKGSAGLW